MIFHKLVWIFLLSQVSHIMCVVSYFAIFVQSVFGSVILTHQASVQYSFLPGFYIVCQFILVLADVSMWCINLRMKNEQHVLGNKNEYEIQCLGWNQECCSNVSVFVPMFVWQKSYYDGHQQFEVLIVRVYLHFVLQVHYIRVSCNRF